MAVDWKMWKVAVEGYERAGSPYGRATDPRAVLRWLREQIRANLGDAHREVEREMLSRPLWDASEHLN